MTERPGLTPSQTVGPFLHLAMADPAARHAVAADHPGVISIAGTVVDGAGDAVPDAVVETWQVDGHFTRCPTGPDGAWDVHTVKPPAVSTRDGTAQAPHLVVSVFARGLLDRVVTRIYFGDEEAANATDPVLAAIDADRRRVLVATAVGRRQYRFDIRLQGADESVFFAIDAFAFLVARGPVAEATSATAWLQAMLDAEAALAAAQADVGDIPADAAGAIAAACQVDRFDVDAVLDDAALGGNPVIPLVARLRELVGPAAAEHVHRHATSQDIVDAATAVVVRRSAELVADALLTASKSSAGIGERHGGTPMISRTLGQYAVPSTFGAVTARWCDGLAQASAAIAGTDRMMVVLGGPSGDGTSYGEHRAEITDRFALRLRLRTGLRSAGHTQRGSTAEVAGAWGLAAAAVAKVALDIVLLAQSDIGEVAERADGAGGSSSMAHKHNPIAAICARAAAMQAPGLVATLLHAAGGHELERAAGAWHAEWPALDQLLRVTGSAVDWLQTSLDRLVVEPDRMAANLARARAAAT